MPIYEYTCKTCDAKFEQLQRSMTQPQAVKCPACGSSETTRAMSVFAVGAQAGNVRLATGGNGLCGRCGGPGPCGMGD